MFALELGLTTIGLGIAFLCHGRRRWIFNLSIVVFLTAFLLGSVALVVGGVAMLGLGSIEPSISSHRILRMRVFAVTGVLLLAAIVLPAMEQPQPIQSPNRAAIASADTIRSLQQIDPKALLAENKDLVNEIAKDLLGNFRKRAFEVVKQEDDVELSTTIDFKAPAELLGIQFASHDTSTSSNHAETQTGRLKLHATLGDATTCNECHAMGSEPLHAALHYDWAMGDQESDTGEFLPAERPNQCDPDHRLLDSDLFVHAN